MSPYSCNFSSLLLLCKPLPSHFDAQQSRSPENCYPLVVIPTSSAPRPSKSSNCPGNSTPLHHTNIARSTSAVIACTVRQPFIFKYFAGQRKTRCNVGPASKLGTDSRSRIVSGQARGVGIEDGNRWKRLPNTPQRDTDGCKLDVVEGGAWGGHYEVCVSVGNGR